MGDDTAIMDKFLFEEEGSAGDNFLSFNVFEDVDMGVKILEDIGELFFSYIAGIRELR